MSVPADQEIGKAPELPVEVQEQLAELERLKSHHAKFLEETKTAKARASELEAAQAAAEEQRLKEKQEFKELYEREQASKRELSEKFEGFQTRIQQQELTIAANTVAALVTKDTARAELVAEKIKGLSRHTELGVVYEVGGIEVDAEKAAAYVASKYPFLADGSGNTGGGATGGSRGSASQGGNMGGDREQRKAAIAAKFNL